MHKIRRIIENYGLYVIFGGLSLIGLVPVPFLSDLYSSIFILELRPTAKRFLGCFLVLQGCVRFNYTRHDFLSDRCPAFRKRILDYEQY